MTLQADLDFAAVLVEEGEQYLAVSVFVGLPAVEQLDEGKGVIDRNPIGARRMALSVAIVRRGM